MITNDLGVSINGGTPKCMVYDGISDPIKMGDLGGTPISGNPQMVVYHS